MSFPTILLIEENICTKINSEDSQLNEVVCDFNLANTSFVVLLMWIKRKSYAISVEYIRFGPYCDPHINPFVH